MRRSKSAIQIIFQITILFLLTFCACQHPNDNVIKTIEIEKNISSFESMTICEISDSIEYVRLETSKECLIEKIKYIDITEKLIIIYDWNKCLLFDHSGRFLRQIGRVGRGPGEYLHVGQIRLKGDEIFIPDAIDDLFKIYSTEGKFIEAIESPGNFSNRSQINNYMLVSDSLFLVQVANFSGKEPNRVLLIDRNAKILKRYRNTTFFNLDKPRYGSSNYAQFFKFEEKVRYKESLNDTVWQIDQDLMNPVYILNTGKYGVPNSVLSLPLTSYSHELSNTIRLEMIFETSNYIFIKTLFQKHYPFKFYKKYQLGGRQIPFSILGVYDKSKNKFFFVAPTNIHDQIYPTGIENDYDGGINFMPIYKNGNRLMASWINSFELNNYVSSETFKNSTPKYPEKKRKLEQLANSLDENDNPVLMLVKLKE